MWGPKEIQLNLWIRSVFRCNTHPSGLKALTVLMKLNLAALTVSLLCCFNSVYWLPFSSIFWTTTHRWADLFLFLQKIQLSDTFKDKERHWTLLEQSLLHGNQISTAEGGTYKVVQQMNSIATVTKPFLYDIVK